MSDVNSLFLTATREKYRFSSPAGQLSVEDLWDLPLSSAKGPSLDAVAKTLHRELKDAEGEVSFVRPAVKSTTELQAKFDIVKFVIETLVTERDAKTARAEKGAQRQKLLELLAKKKDESLEEKSPEELQAMIDAL